MTFLAVAQGLSHGKPCFNSLGESHFFCPTLATLSLALSFPYVPLMKLFFLSSVKDSTDDFCNVLRLCFI